MSAEKGSQRNSPILIRVSETWISGYKKIVHDSEFEEASARIRKAQDMLTSVRSE